MIQEIKLFFARLLPENLREIGSAGRAIRVRSSLQKRDGFRLKTLRFFTETTIPFSESRNQLRHGGFYFLWHKIQNQLLTSVRSVFSVAKKEVPPRAGAAGATATEGDHSTPAGLGGGKPGMEKRESTNRNDSRMQGRGNLGCFVPWLLKRETARTTDWVALDDESDTEGQSAAAQKHFAHMRPAGRRMVNIKLIMGITLNR